MADARLRPEREHMVRPLGTAHHADGGDARIELCGASREIDTDDRAPHTPSKMGQDSTTTVASL